MPQIRPIPGTERGGTEYVQAYAGPSATETEQAFVLPAPFGASSPDGLGAYARPVVDPRMFQPAQSGSGVLSGSPIARAMQRVMNHRRQKAMRGLGDTTTTPAASAAAPVVAGIALGAFVMADLLLCGVAGYFVGKAVAPSHSEENKYAWWGVAAGLIGGPVGLGIEAVVALNHKGGR